MKEIFENYLAIVLGEKQLPKRRPQGLTKGLLEQNLSHYVTLGKARPKKLLEMVRQGDGNARKLLIEAAVRGHQRQFEVFNQYEKSREVTNV